VRALIDARPALDPGRTGVGHYAQQLIRHLPHVDPQDRYVAWYLHARGLFRHKSFFADAGAPNLEEAASRFPARIFQPVSWRLHAPRVEWLAGDFDVLLATNFLPLGFTLLTWWLLARRRVSPILLLVIYVVFAMLAAYPFFGPAGEFNYCQSLLNPFFQPGAGCPPPAS